MKSRYKLSTVSGLLLAMGIRPGHGFGQCRGGPVQSQNPAAVCVPASKVGIDLRNRPLAVQNEGAAPIFVNCSFTTMGYYDEDDRNPAKVDMYFSVNDGHDDSISCTAVLGYKSDSSPIMKVTKAMDLPADGEEVGLTWLPADFGSADVMPSGLFNVQCVLNPGVGINDSYVFFNE